MYGLPHESELENEFRRKIAGDLRNRAANMSALDAWHDRNDKAQALYDAADFVEFPNGKPAISIQQLKTRITISRADLWSIPENPHPSPFQEKRHGP